MPKCSGPIKSEPKAIVAASAEPFRFRDLPIEVRTCIYEQVFSGATIGFDTQCGFMASESSIHRNLLLASKDCYREGNVFYHRSIKTLVLGDYDFENAHGMILEYLPHASEIRMLKDTTLLSAAMIPTVMPKLNRIKMPKFEFEAMGKYGDIDVECWGEQLEWTEYLQGCLPEVTKETLPAIEVTGAVRFERSCVFASIAVIERVR